MYSEIESFQSDFQAYYQYKKDKMYQEIEPKQGEITAANLLMYDFFIIGYASDLQERCKRNLKTLKETVAELEKAL